MQKIKDGALFAIGFMIVALVIGYGYSLIASAIFGVGDDFLAGQSVKIDVLESRLVRRDDRIVVLGRFANRDDKTWRRVTIRADLFGENELFLDQCEESLGGNFGSGEESNFKLVCASCADLTIDDIASHKVTIADGF
jgi:hypothetical protein